MHSFAHGKNNVVKNSEFITKKEATGDLMWSHSGSGI